MLTCEEEEALLDHCPQSPLSLSALSTFPQKQNSFVLLLLQRDLLLTVVLRATHE